MNMLSLTQKKNVHFAYQVAQEQAEVENKARTIAELLEQLESARAKIKELEDQIGANASAAEAEVSEDESIPSI